MVALIFRILAFLVSASVTLFLIWAVDLVLIPLTLERLTSTEFPPDYRPSVSFSAMIICVLSVTALFGKIVRKKPARHHAIALVFLFACNAIGFVFTVVGQSAAASAISWIGVICLAAYYLIKPFKKPMISATEGEELTRSDC